MDAAIDTDVERLNSRLFAFASDPAQREELLKGLGASAQVIHRIGQATPAGVKTAADCGVPLLVFTSAVGELLMSKPSAWSERGGAASGTDRALVELTALMVSTSVRAARLFPFLGETHFGLTAPQSKRLIELSLRDADALVRCDRVLIELRDREDAEFWGRVLSGDRFRDERAQWLANSAAFQSCGQT